MGIAGIESLGRSDVLIRVVMQQVKQAEWHEQWSMFQDEERYLFLDWIHPNTLEDFRDKDLLECGCGGGQHTSFMAPYARRVTAVDLNTTDIAATRNRNFKNVELIEADIANMDLGREFDVVLSVGVVHHTDDPNKTVRNLIKHLRRGGRLILWVYSDEGNFLAKNAVEPIRKLWLRKMSRKALSLISKALTGLLYIPVYSVYRLPLRALPYYEYFENFRTMSFYRNNLNVFDKLNAPQVQFICGERVAGWLSADEFEDVHVSRYKGVSWRASGTRR